MKSSAYQVFRIPDFRNYFIARLFFLFGLQMQSLIIQWQIYEITGSKLNLGLIGLAEAIPYIFTSLYGGTVADRIDRKRIIVTAVFAYVALVVCLLFLSINFETIQPIFGVLPIYAIIFLTGVARGFLSPAQSALAAQLVPRDQLVNASTFSSSVYDISNIGGPTIAGILYAYTQSPTTCYIVVLVLCSIGFIFYNLISAQPMPVVNTDESLMQRIGSGFKFVFANKIMLGALALDMFAVLFGGAVAMLPAFCDEILKGGPEVLGILRAAPSVGAILMAIIVARFPLNQKAGPTLLWSVAIFGLSIIGFALSQNIYIAFAMLMIYGMSDEVSVIIRTTIVQLFTPEEMRGRVSSVNGIFIGSSNEIGAFESGVAAHFLGLVPSIVFGGCMTLLIVLVTWKLVPQMQKLELK